MSARCLSRSMGSGRTGSRGTESLEEIMGSGGMLLHMVRLGPGRMEREPRGSSSHSRRFCDPSKRRCPYSRSGEDYCTGTGGFSRKAPRESRRSGPPRTPSDRGECCAIVGEDPWSDSSGRSWSRLQAAPNTRDKPGTRGPWGASSSKVEASPVDLGVIVQLRILPLWRRNCNA